VVVIGIIAVLLITAAMYVVIWVMIPNVQERTKRLLITVTLTRPRVKTRQKSRREQKYSLITDVEVKPTVLRAP